MERGDVSEICQGSSFALESVDPQSESYFVDELQPTAEAYLAVTPNPGSLDT